MKWFLVPSCDRSWKRVFLDCYRGGRDPSQPATDYRFEREGGIVGFIDSVSQPFCQSCDRIRLTAEGKLRNCLFGQEEWDLSPWVVAF